MIRGILRRIDKQNRITIPNEYVEMLDIKENEKLEILVIDNKLSIRKVADYGIYRKPDGITIGRNKRR